MRDKSGEVSSELVKIIIAVLILVTMVAVIVVLYVKGGGDILSSIRNVFRFGR